LGGLALVHVESARAQPRVDNSDQASNDLAVVLAQEFAVWFRNLGVQGILPRAFTGVTKDGKQGIIILTGLPFDRLQQPEGSDYRLWS
jgi:hypothetical protein